jgi:hypothetical protein
MAIGLGSGEVHVMKDQITQGSGMEQNEAMDGRRELTHNGMERLGRLQHGKNAGRILSR